MGGGINPPISKRSRENPEWIGLWLCCAYGRNTYEGKSQVLGLSAPVQVSLAQTEVIPNLLLLLCLRPANCLSRLCEENGKAPGLSPFISLAYSWQQLIETSNLMIQKSKHVSYYSYKTYIILLLLDGRVLKAVILIWSLQAKFLEFCIQTWIISEHWIVHSGKFEKRGVS